MKKTLAVVLIALFALSSFFGCSVVTELRRSLSACISPDTPAPDPTDPPVAVVTDVPEPVVTDVPEPVATDTPEPTDTPSPEPTEEPTPEPTDTPSPEPTEPPTPVPSSFLFGGVEVMAGQASVSVTGKKNAIIKITPEEMDMLIKLCPNLTNLDLAYCCMPDYSRIGELTNLKHLLITSTTHEKDPGIPLVDIDWVASLKNLRYLHLTYNKINDIRAIANLTNLEQLNLGWNELADDDLEWLTGLHLKELYLYCNAPLRDVSALSKIKSLELLHIGGNKKVKGLKALTALSNLKTLDISYCPNDGFGWIKDFKKLETLRIEYSAYINHDAYADLRLCKTLKKVVISKQDKKTETAIKDMIKDYKSKIEIAYWEDYSGN